LFAGLRDSASRDTRITSLGSQVPNR
jgi:hypothetical protein